MTGVDRLLILGGSGFVGRELTNRFRCRATSTLGGDGFLAADATRPEQLRALLERERPRVLVNCVGLADVDRAEREPELAESLNHRVVEGLVRFQGEFPFRLVHISTDYVFDGGRGNYTEDDATRPVNEYGRSKRRGEEAAGRSPDALVVRISSPFGRGFGARKTQFFRYVTEQLRRGSPVKALTDQRVTATYLEDLASAIEALLARDVRGIVHVGSEEALSRHEFALKVAQVVGADPALVEPARMAEMTQWVAARPADTTLSVARSRSAGVHYTPVTAALRELLTT